MPVIVATRRFSFDAGHRILGHEGRCRWLHGHTYLAEVSVIAPQLDNKGMVIDFAVLKEKIGKWIDDNWDHNFICHVDDPLLELPRLNSTRVFSGRKPYMMPVGLNPTAENMALVLLEVAQKLLAVNLIEVARVRVWETPNCHAEVHTYCDGALPEETKT